MHKIQLYSLATPNGQKVSIALEEMGVPYEAHRIDISNGDQFKPDFVKISPNSKIPVITDPNGPEGKELHIMESGAILIYLADKSGRFLSNDARVRCETLQWLFFQAAHIGPMFGQFGHFFKYARDKCNDPYPVERYSNESKRLLGVLEARLKGRQFIVHDELSIADMAIVPWVKCLDVFYGGRDQLNLSGFPLVDAWVRRCWDRPGFQRGSVVCSP